MMLTENFQLSIPTHISFTLYKYDLIDSMIISRVRKECRDYSTLSGTVKIYVPDFIRALESSPRLMAEIKRCEGDNHSPNFKPNSVYFLYKIITSLSNLDWVSFKVSHDKEYTRIVKFDNQEILNFYYRIEEGYLNLPEVLSREELDVFNKLLISMKAIPNNYLERASYFYIRASNLLDIITSGAFSGAGAEIAEYIIDIIDPKIDEDDPLLTVKTDYTIY